MKCGLPQMVCMPLLQPSIRKHQISMRTGLQGHTFFATQIPNKMRDYHVSSTSVMIKAIGAKVTYRVTTDMIPPTTIRCSTQSLPVYSVPPKVFITRQQAINAEIGHF